MMKSRRTSVNNSSATGFIIKNSATAPKPVMEIAAPPPPLLPRSQSALLPQRTHSFSAGGVCQNHTYNTLQRQQSVPFDHNYNSLQRQQSVPFDQKKAQPQLQSVLSKPNNKLMNPEAIFPNQKEGGVGLAGQVIITSTHHAIPQHKMVQVNRPSPFTCMGCKEYGAGICFSCQQCNFELHHFCALAPSLLKAHPLHSQHHLIFYPKPPGKGILRSSCDVCGKVGKGFIYQCSACSFQIHPCCQLLSPKMKFPTHPQHALILMPSNLNLQSVGGDALCAVCRRKRSGQVYRCTVCDYYLHAVCAKNMVNGLHALGIKGLDKPSVLGTAAKIASQVVVGFVEGIFEGIGEGLGEALTQNFAKGTCETSAASASARSTPSTSPRHMPHTKHSCVNKNGQ